MASRMLLSEQGKQAAKYLAEAWNKGVVQSRFTLIDASAGSTNLLVTLPGLGVVKHEEFTSPPVGDLYELDRCGLIEISERSSDDGTFWTVQLVQNLREAVENGFLATPNVGGIDTTLPSIFISYKRDDESITKDLARFLGRVYGEGSVWFDRTLYGGQQWWNEIVAQIATRQAFIYLLSREALESIYCRAEFTEAWRLRRRIVPIKVRKIGSLGPIENFHCLDMSLKITAEEIVQVFAALTRPQIDTPIIPENSIWAKRAIYARESKRITVKAPVSAKVEPSEAHLCNTGILLVEGDELHVIASGKVSYDSGENWTNAQGVHLEGGYLGNQVFHPDAYHTPGGYISENIKDQGLVGSLIGWISDFAGEINDAFFIGDEFRTTIAVSTPGFLYLAVNDAKGTYEDNQGEFQVTIQLKQSDRNMNSG